MQTLGREHIGTPLKVMQATFVLLRRHQGVLFPMISSVFKGPIIKSHLNKVFMSGYCTEQHAIATFTEYVTNSMGTFKGLLRDLCHSIARNETFDVAKDKVQDFITSLRGLANKAEHGEWDCEGDSSEEVAREDHDGTEDWDVIDKSEIFH
jgi:hypothetical protein